SAPTAPSPWTRAGSTTGQFGWMAHGYIGLAYPGSLGRGGISPKRHCSGSGSQSKRSEKIISAVSVPQLHRPQPIAPRNQPGPLTALLILDLIALHMT